MGETIERVIKVLKHRIDETILPPVLQKREGYSPPRAWVKPSDTQ
jgi:hypothetical protein